VLIFNLLNSNLLNSNLVNLNLAIFYRDILLPDTIIAENLTKRLQYDKFNRVDCNVTDWRVVLLMDAHTKARYDEWRWKRIKKRVILPGVILLCAVILLVFGIVSCNRREDDRELPESDPAEEHESETIPESEPEVDAAEARIQFVGDILLHPTYPGSVEIARTGDNTFDFNPFLSYIAPYIDGDLSIANMETPVDVMGQNQDLTSFPLFNVPYEILEALQYAGFNHLISANNHSFDRGFEGLVATVNNFERAGIDHTGMYIDEVAFGNSTILDINGIQVGIIAYTDSVNGMEGIVPEAMRPFAVRRFRSYVLDDIPHMATDIANLRATGAELVIVALHWGAEYVDKPTEMQRLIARELSEVGADVIMGKHSHTVQPMEWHEREDGSQSLIMYSLGNFLADQTRLTSASVESQINDSWGGHQFIGRTQFGKMVNLQVSRGTDGEITLEADVLPTLTMRDFSGSTLGTVNGVTVLPLFGGEAPEFVTDEDLRNWGRAAYNHVVEIVGEDFIVGSSTY